jgi:hypothetical protein
MVFSPLRARCMFIGLIKKIIFLNFSLSLVALANVTINAKKQSILPTAMIAIHSFMVKNHHRHLARELVGLGKHNACTYWQPATARRVAVFRKESTKNRCKKARGNDGGWSMKRECSRSERDIEIDGKRQQRAAQYDFLRSKPVVGVSFNDQSFLAVL